MLYSEPNYEAIYNPQACCSLNLYYLIFIKNVLPQLRNFTLYAVGIAFKKD